MTGGSAPLPDGARAWPAAPPPAVPLSALPPQPTRAPVKVLHVITKFTAGAGGNTLMSVLGADRSRYDVWVAGAPEGPLWERAEAGGVNIRKLRRMREYLSPSDDAAVLLELVRLIRRERFSIVHTHSSKAGVLGRVAAWLCRTPVVVHTIHGFAFHPYMSRRRSRFYVTAERLVRPLTDAFFAVAPEVAREAVDRGLAPPGGIMVAPSAVELDQLVADADPALKAEIAGPGDGPLIGTVGRLDAQKAPLDFVRMAALVAKSVAHARFAMVGEGPLLDDAKAEAERLGVDIIFTGFRSDAPRVAASFDVFVISSLYEGLGRALTEALGSGRPVVATAVNGVVDLVEPGSTGLLAPPGDPEALAANVCWMLDHPNAARRMGEAGRERVHALFAPARMCATIEEEYARLLGMPSVRPAGAQ